MFILGSWFCKVSLPLGERSGSEDTIKTRSETGIGRVFFEVDKGRGHTKLKSEVEKTGDKRVFLIRARRGHGQRKL